MYLDCQVKIPETNGKITKKTIKGTVYIYYEYARVYLKDKKYNTPKRVCVGKQVPGQPLLMLPNDRFLKTFPQELLPEEKSHYRSGCLRIGAFVMTATNVQKQANTISSDLARLEIEAFEKAAAASAQI